MTDVVRVLEAEPLRLDAAWRLADAGARGGEGATVHPLRVVTSEERGTSGTDREALRALVAEIVRDELRSELGHRMTRSIRRLVRDEVAHLFSRIAPRSQ